MKTQNRLEVSRTSIVIFRIMLSLIFIVGSLNHFFQLEKTVARIEQAKFSFLANLLGTPEISVIVSGMVMFFSGIFLLIGFKTKYAAIALIAVLIPITLTIQVGQINTLGPLFKNIGLLGGLLFFSLNNFKFKTSIK